LALSAAWVKGGRPHQFPKPSKNQGVGRKGAEKSRAEQSRAEQRRERAGRAQQRERVKT